MRQERKLGGCPGHRGGWDRGTTGEKRVISNNDGPDPADARRRLVGFDILDGVFMDVIDFLSGPIVPRHTFLHDNTAKKFDCTKKRASAARSY